ncbi:MAG: hypothetical protein GY696_19405 [Gammaproteobacteria bacterium]|nr:hypothetical protein [Gammaproteobacteria bacterium]
MDRWIAALPDEIDKLHNWWVGNRGRGPSNMVMSLDKSGCNTITPTVSEGEFASEITVEGEPSDKRRHVHKESDATKSKMHHHAMADAFTYLCMKSNSDCSSVDCGVNGICFRFNASLEVCSCNDGWHGALCDQTGDCSKCAVLFSKNCMP